MLPNYEALDLRLDGKVAIVSLNRPEKANSMNETMWQELQACFEWADDEPGVRAVVLAGNGKHFCAGIDLGMFGALQGTSDDPARKAEYFRRKVLGLQGNLTAIEKCRKPVLAAIHGACIGGGVDMACCADIRYASSNAKFSIREIDLGMTADVGTLQRMPRIIPDAVVRELAYTGRDMRADEALAHGYVNRVFDDPETLLTEVVAIAQSIASKSPLAIRGTKEMLLYVRDHSVEDGLNYIATWNAGMFSQADITAGLIAQRDGTEAQYED
jgi:enoyl-CoA hydratase/carnithine racemase